MDCEFCHKKFSTKQNLLYHQKNTKYCLDLQGKSNENFMCEYCNKVFTCKQRLTIHIKETCKLKNKKSFEDEMKKLNEDFIHFKKESKNKLKEKDKIIYKLESKIEKLENTILSLAIEPKTKNTTNHVVINNTLNLSKEHVTKILDEHLTKDIVAGGQKKLAQMVCEKMLKDSEGNLTYKCVDSSRHNFEFINLNGLIEKDIKALKLKNALISGNIIAKAGETGKTIWTKTDGTTNSDQYIASSDKVMEIICIDIDDSKFRSALTI